MAYLREVPVWEYYMDSLHGGWVWGGSGMLRVLVSAFVYSGARARLSAPG